MSSHSLQVTKLPYYAPASQLPAPLPSFKEIKASKHARYPCVWDDRTIVRVGEYFVVKYDAGVELSEAQNMIFVANSCGRSAVVPKIYAVYEETERNSFFEASVKVIVMEYIPGPRLAAVYETWGEEQKQTTVARLRQQLDVVRAIPSPRFYGALGAESFKEGFWTAGKRGNAARRSGPYFEHSEFVRGLMARLVIYQPPADAPELAASLLEIEPQPATSVFTHCDLQPKNIVLRESDGLPIIVDWELSGFFPPCWEYVVVAKQLEARVEPAWVPWMEQLFPEFIEAGEIVERARQ
ncbi:hypothetical protein F4778DRAFT_724671 [Xylariomycetidae sp. FL2044]|nr:hypothetical protein F4778DRAFT_724671 [Xylariomycetidae sp. FL2044]